MAEMFCNSPKYLLFCLQLMWYVCLPLHKLLAGGHLHGIQLGKLLRLLNYKFDTII